MLRVLEEEYVCLSCGRIEQPPECHGKAMEHDGEVLFCPTCGKELKVPQCCGQPMSRRRKVRDIRRELFGVP